MSLVHVHDTFLPDPYPATWAWRGYAEQSGLAAWMLAGGVRPVFSSHWALTRVNAAERPTIAVLPLPKGAFETSLWMEKITGPVSPAQP